MSERNVGQVVPFRVNTARLRRSAQEYHRRGRPVEAVELLRHAALKEDSAAGWLHLAEQLRKLGCCEQASALLYRLLARKDAPLRTWLELGCAQLNLGHMEAVQDCACHFLNEDPYSAGADEARAMLDEVHAADAEGEPLRLERLARRGLLAWQDGNTQMGERRIRRAIRLSERPGKLRVQLALLLMQQGRMKEALACLVAAYREEPENVRTACTLSMFLESIGRRRLALGILQGAARFCTNAAEEEMLLAAAWAQQAWKTYETLVMERYRQQPCCIWLLHHMALLQWQKGEKEGAEGYWQRILRIDPDDFRASYLLRWAAEHTVEEDLPAKNAAAMDMAEQWKRDFARAVEAEQSPAEMLKPGTETRRVIDWCFATNDLTVQRLCLEMLMTQDAPEIRLYLRELLTSPSACQEVKQMALLCLTKLEKGARLQVLMGQRMGEVECRPVAEGTKHLWRAFLYRLLVETRRHRQSPDIVKLAANLWPKLSQMQRQKAAGQDALVWIKALEICYLNRTGQEQAARAAVRNMPASQHRVDRVLQQIGSIIELEHKAEE